MTDPHDMGKLDPRGTVGMIYAGDHKTLLYTKYINYGPHRKKILKVFFFVDHQGLGQFAPKRLDWQDLSVCVCVCVWGGGGGGEAPGALDPAAYYMVSEDFFP